LIRVFELLVYVRSGSVVVQLWSLSLRFSHQL